MKKFVTIIVCLLCASMTYSIIYEYVDESGRSFFYNKSRMRLLGEPYERSLTDDELDFIGAQVLSCHVESNDPNYDKEEMIRELKLKYRDLVFELYNQNKEYMETNFPDHTYTFDEVYDFAESVATGMVFLGYEYECYITMSFSISEMFLYRMKEVKSHPYILGYLYKEVKYKDGKKCKLQHLSGVKIN